MQSVQAVHEYMFRCLMVSVAVTSHAICAWNVSEVQISIQIYAFNSDVKWWKCFQSSENHFASLSSCWTDAIFVWKWREYLRCIFYIFFIIAFTNFCDTVLLQYCHWLKLLQWKLIACISTVFLRLLELNYSEASLS